MSKVKYIVFCYNHKTFKVHRESFSTLIDAKVFKREMMKEYKKIDIIKRTVFEELIL
ncbi:hypothetical protein [Clostridioides sp. ZZV14-6044]|uniref:hypothetical protein n=1 Tax=unclassified Clostridioides TaxID=2635829 RepID=UPI001D0F640D|nr:hypothetical protein [Clostridioides sp. ZZV14-6104]MCC0744589.1 hypothetical protein [Clostridioides sp. ZZV14-6044]